MFAVVFTFGQLLTTQEHFDEFEIFMRERIGLTDNSDDLPSIRLIRRNLSSNR